MPLTVTTEPKENRQLAMTIEVDQKRVDQELRKAARRLAQQVRIPGFRRGKAPYDVVVRYLGGVGALFEEFVDDLGQEVYKEAIEQEDIEPYATASLDNIEIEPLRYELTVPLAPEVKLGDYRSLRVEEPQTEVDEEEVQARVDQILERHSGYQDVDRPSEYGDLMTIDVRAVVLDEEGNETDTVVLDEEDWDVTPDEENPMEPAGFDEELLGMAPGDEKSFDIAWPEDSPSMYAGKNVRFRVTVHDIQAYQKPELTDELAQEIGDYESAEDLVESIRESLREEAEEESESQYLEEVLDKLVEMSELDYPPAAVEMQIDQMMRNTDMQIRQMGMQGIEQYLQLVGQSMQEYRSSLQAQAETYLRRNLVLAEIAQAEKLSVSDEEFNERLNEMLGEPSEDAGEEEKESRQGVFDMMRQTQNRAMVDDQIISDKAIERVLAIARGEEIPEPVAPAEATEGEEDDESTVAAEAGATEADEPEAGATETTSAADATQA